MRDLRVGSLVEKETDLFRVDTVLRTAGWTELNGERTETSTVKIH